MHCYIYSEVKQSQYGYDGVIYISTYIEWADCITWFIYLLMSTFS